MTSRTIDIHCHACRKYLHSEMPTYNWNETWVKKHYCKKKACQEQATFDALKGDEPTTVTQVDVDKIMSEIRALIQNNKNKKNLGP